MTTETRAILVDITKCIGCQQCSAGCKTAHQQPGDPEPTMSATAFTAVEPRGDKFVRRMCLHCEDPACASVCPVGAIKKTAQGAVRYDGSKCIGCRYCMIACPYSVPKYEWSKLAPYVVKCDMCAERVLGGQQPACVEACPTGASTFGRREDLLLEARKRIVENPGTYVDRIYGEYELGGTSVLYITDVPFEKLGFITPPAQQPLPTLSAAALGEVPTVVGVGGTLLAGLYWITERRKEVALAEARAAKENERS
jgi:formate dehydrogenase iron-sulfur subunit